MASPSPQKGVGVVVKEMLTVLLMSAVAVSALVVGLKQLDPNRQASINAKEKKKEIARRLGRPSLVLNQYEDQIAMDVVNPEHINVTFDTIGGLEDVKEALHELVILPLTRPELFSGGKLLKPQKGALLYGPPGTGKTMLAKAIAKESNAVFINVRVASLMSKWFGDAQKLVTAVFTLAWKLQPSIIFIDEVDSFLGHRRANEHEAVTSMKTEFMSLWDGFVTDDDARVMVLAASNRPWELDEAILRRLPRTFEVGMPDLSQRMEIFKVLLRGENVEPGINVGRLAALTEGYSGSDLTEVAKQAAYLPIRDLLEEEKQLEKQLGGLDPGQAGVRSTPRPLRMSDFEAAVETTRPSKEVAVSYLRSRTQSDASTPLGNNRQSEEGSSTGGRSASTDELFAAFMAALLAKSSGR